MEDILGSLAFAGLIAAQFVAVIAVHKANRNGSPPAKAALGRRACPVVTCAAEREDKALSSLHEKAMPGLAFRADPLR